jgi:phage replication O-like protein O
VLIWAAPYYFLDDNMPKANPQKENGSTAIANDILDSLCRARIPGEARQVLDFIIRKTYGWNKKWDAISLSQFALGTGLKRPNICRLLKKLEKMKLIVIKKDNAGINKYMFNKHYDEWKLLSKKPTIIKNDNRGVSKMIMGGYHFEDIQNTSLQNTILQNTLGGNQKADSRRCLGGCFFAPDDKKDFKQKFAAAFKFWNSKKIVSHRKPTIGMVDAYRQWYRQGIAIGDTIEVYNAVLTSPITKWRHKWTFDEFLRKGIPKFLNMTVDDAINNYLIPGEE